MTTLTSCSLSLPNTSKIDNHLKTFIEKSLGKGERTVDYANNEIRYKMDSSPSNKGKLASRKRKAGSPTTVDMSQCLAKEVKTEHNNLTLSTNNHNVSSDEEQESSISGEDDDEIHSSEILQRHSSHSPVQDNNDRPNCHSIIKREVGDDTNTTTEDEQVAESFINCREAISKMTVSELRMEAKSRGLDSRGFKSVLVQRLLASALEEEEGAVPPKLDQVVFKQIYTKTKSTYELAEEPPLIATREVRDFPALGTVEVNRFLADFAKVPENTVVLPYGRFTYLRSPKKPSSKGSSGKLRRPQKWTFPCEPREIQAIRDSVKGKKLLLLPINFVSLFKFDHQNTNHVVFCVVDLEKEKIRYFDSNYTQTTIKNSAEYRRFRIVQTEIYGTLRLYDLKAKVKPKFELEIVLACYGKKEGLESNWSSVLLFCLLDQLWEGKEEILFPAISETRVKAGEVMKALELGTPNFLEEDEWQEWERQEWGGAGRRR